MDASAGETAVPSSSRQQEAAHLKATLKRLRTEPRGWVFSLKLALCVVLTGTGVTLALQPVLWCRIVGVLLTGAMFAHAAELQHETLHNLAYRSSRANTVTGIVLGLPMLISFAAYRATHMRHHRDLGTPMNREFFDYGDQYGENSERSRLAVFLTWAVRFSMVYHYAFFLAHLGRSLLGRDFPGENARVSRRIRRDHFLIATTAAGLGALTWWTGNAIIVWAWILPLLLVAAPVHAAIELPEHYGCETLNRDPFANTRTIRSNRIAMWFTNGNNYHVEHHLMPNLPIERLPDLHTEVRDRIRYFHSGYLDYFVKLLRK
ncbi:fatty acid desaturase family protein [Streptomyces sp. NPDC059578]|uniref:fatty acid desaturase family protein n=1 Tax=Streptomyces sp. NPDC059578 TaxID=3346874 RepID=UPI00367E7BBE